MGVDVGTWCKTVREHPLKYRFDGLDGFHTDVREAAVHDSQFMECYLEQETKHYEAELEEKDECAVERYCDYLIHKLRVGLHDEELITRCLEPDYSWELVEALEAEVKEARWEWAYEQVGPQWCWECIREGDDEYLLKEHPPIEVWDPAYGCGFPIDNVVYICPSCGRYPMTTDALEDNGHRHYCGLCGGEYLEPHDFRNKEDLQKFAETVGLTLYPFGGEHENRGAGGQDT